MSNTPVLKIQVDDSAFKAFLSSFDAYTDKVDELPAAWQKLNAELKNGGKASAESLAALGGMLGLVSETSKKLREAVHQQKNLGEQTTRSAKAMHGLASGAKSLAHHVFGLGKFLMKIGGLGGLLGGFGGLFALSELAKEGFAQRREALGNSVSVGMMTSFKNNMGQYVNPNLIGNIAGAQQNVSQLWQLRDAAGMSHGTTHMNAGELTLRLVERAKAFVDKNWHDNKRIMTQLMAAHGFSQLGFTFADMNRLHAASMAQLQASIARTQADQWSEGQGHGWTAVHVAFSNNWSQIMSDLKRDLIHLAPAFIIASKAITNFINTLAMNKNTQKDLADFGKELVKGAKFLGSAKFQSDMDKFGRGLQDFGEMMVSLARDFGFGKGLGVGKGQGGPFKNGHAVKGYNWGKEEVYLLAKQHALEEWKTKHPHSLLGPGESWIDPASLKHGDVNYQLRQVAAELKATRVHLVRQSAHANTARASTRSGHPPINTASSALNAVH